MQVPKKDICLCTPVCQSFCSQEGYKCPGPRGEVKDVLACVLFIVHVRGDILAHSQEVSRPITKGGCLHPDPLGIWGVWQRGELWSRPSGVYPQYALRQTPPSRRPLLWVVSTLLECILVLKYAMSPNTTCPYIEDVQHTKPSYLRTFCCVLLIVSS